MFAGLSVTDIHCPHLSQATRKHITIPSKSGWPDSPFSDSEAHGGGYKCTAVLSFVLNTNLGLRVAANNNIHPCMMSICIALTMFKVTLHAITTAPGFVIGTIRP